MEKIYKQRLKIRITCLLLFFITGGTIRAQYFTKIDNEITTDKGNSRSVNWIDYDNDGDLDVYISNGSNPAINAFLYENKGNGTFIKHPEAAVAINNTSADGSSWADYNNDGYSDLYIVAWYGQRSYLYTNLGNGNFQQEKDGVLGKAGGFSESCSWGDYDNDGFVDLYVANSGENGRVANYFYHNDCGKSFTKIGTGAPAFDKYTSRTVNWVDFDNDGDLDLFVCNESNEGNNLYRNMLKETGKPEFETIANDPVVLGKSSSISSCWGDYDNDGDLDLFIANNGQNNELFQNNGNGTFTKITYGIQCNDGGCSFGCNWVDFDNDGDLDLFVSNGWCSGNLNNFLYKNLLIETGTSNFEKVNDTFVTNDGGWSYGNSWGDYDQDGDPDLLVAKCSQSGNNNHNALFRNEVGNLKSWITIKCVGEITNASAIGAKVFVKALINTIPVWQMREVSAQQSYCSENLYSHFGLGNATVIDSIIVKWPSGIVQSLTNTGINQLLTIVEDTLLFTGIRPTCESLTSTNPVNTTTKSNLLSVYPNPTDGILTIAYKISSPGPVTIGIFDSTGKEIHRLTNEYQQDGSYTIQFDSKKLPGGFYFIRLNSAGTIDTEKFILKN
jgi:enediyne biosynthesis protein E4